MTAAIEILFFALTGASFGELSRIYRVGRTTVGAIIHEVSHVIYQVLQPIYMHVSVFLLNDIAYWLIKCVL